MLRRVPLKGRQQGLNPWATERLGVRFIYSPPLIKMVRKNLWPCIRVVSEASLSSWLRGFEPRQGHHNFLKKKLDTLL